MVKIVHMKTMSTGRTRINLMERLRPLGSCHTACSPDSVEASKSGRSAGVSVDVVDVAPPFPVLPSRLVLLEPEKHRQPDWLRLRFNVGLFSRSCSAKHF